MGKNDFKDFDSSPKPPGRRLTRRHFLGSATAITGLGLLAIAGQQLGTSSENKPDETKPEAPSPSPSILAPPPFT